MSPPSAIAAAVGYLLGSVPCGYLVARAKGVNIFEVGSKSPGATNVKRVLGKGPGNLVFLLDALKGAVAAGWPMLHAWLRDRHRFTVSVGDSPPFDGLARLAWHASFSHVLPACVIGLVAALVGHSFSCFTKFKGGKGVATAAGGLLVLMPWVIVIGAGVWAATFYLSRYVSLASILAALALPVAAWFLVEPPPLIDLAGLITLFVIIRHRANLVRLWHGTENKFAKKTTPTP